MSGLEVAGLVLGAFPVALEILDKYKEVARRFGFWYKIAAEHRNCDSQLKFHRFVYIDNLKMLLLPLAGLDDTHIDELLQDPGGKAWSEARTAEQLEQRLGDSHEIYMQFMNEFQEWLHAIKTKLAFDPETKQQSRESLSAVSLTASRKGITHQRELTLSSRKRIGLGLELRCSRTGENGNCTESNSVRTRRSGVRSSPSFKAAMIGSRHCCRSARTMPS